jgi:hypothetical protein
MAKEMVDALRVSCWQTLRTSRRYERQRRIGRIAHFRWRLGGQAYATLHGSQVAGMKHKSQVTDHGTLITPHHSLLTSRR